MMASSSRAFVLLARSSSSSTRRDAGEIVTSGLRAVAATLGRPLGLPKEFSSSSRLPTSTSSTSSYSSPSTTPCPPSPPPPFSVDAASAALALRSKPASDLLRSYLVLSACRCRPLVAHGERLLKVARALPPLRDLVVDPILKRTFFAQFCGGGSEEELGPCVARLRRQGIGAILDYAAEPEEGSSSSGSPGPSGSSASRPPPRRSAAPSAAEAAVAAAAAPPSLAVARTHEYGDEALCDSNAGHVLRAIEAAAAAADAGSAEGGEAGGGGGAAEASEASEASGAAFAAAAAASSSSSSSSPSSSPSPSASNNDLPSGYAAVKLTALTDPKVLVKLSACLREIEKLFEKFDADADGRVSRSEFEAAYRETFTDGDAPGRLDELWRYLSRGGHGEKEGGEGAAGEQRQRVEAFVDKRTWTSRVRLRDVPSIVPRCRTLGPLAAASPTDEELGRLESLMGRLRRLAAAAKEKNVRLLVDAEYTAVQPAIDAAALELMREFNSSDSSTFAVPPTVYNTTQCYLRGAREKLLGEIELAAKGNFAWGGKLVRGAYIDSENKRAAAANQVSPCWPSLEQTHACFDACARIAIEEGVFAAQKGEALLATHNKASVGKAVDLLSRLEKEHGHPAGGAASSRVSFGQLYGMSESLTLAIARAGRRAYVYLPYGPLGDVLPYLLRRALENSQMLSGGGRKKENREEGKKEEQSELDAVRGELKARLVAVFFPRDR